VYFNELLVERWLRFATLLSLCLSVASTVVLLRVLEDRRMMNSIDGRSAIGWLVVEN
jgi:CPA2 family monovalent cation:H+ antiporter-2